MLRFVLLFGAAFGIGIWLLDGSGPLAGVNTVVQGLARVQTSAAAWLLRLGGEPATAAGTVLTGSRFSCEVDTGCNGMSAVVLVLAGLASFPAAWRPRVLGFLVLVPAVLLVNVVRIAGLYWTGAHHPGWFGPAHVYVGQVLVITVTAALWLTWLSWNSQSPPAS